jgi:hypothetical protein
MNDKESPFVTLIKKSVGLPAGGSTCCISGPVAPVSPPTCCGAGSTSAAADCRDAPPDGGDAAVTTGCC